MEVVQNIALISINATAVVQLVSFLLFMALFNRVMIRPLRKIMTAREAHIQKVGADLTAAGETFELISGQIKEEETQARATASRIREEIETAGRQSVAGLLDQTRREVDALRTEAQSETDHKIAVARKNIQTEAQALCDMMVTTLLAPRSIP